MLMKKKTKMSTESVMSAKRAIRLNGDQIQLVFLDLVLNAKFWICRE